jgi:hypothetical protein
MTDQTSKTREQLEQILIEHSAWTANDEHNEATLDAMEEALALKSGDSERGEHSHIETREQAVDLLQRCQQENADLRIRLAEMTELSIQHKREINDLKELGGESSLRQDLERAKSRVGELEAVVQELVRLKDLKEAIDAADDPWRRIRMDEDLGGGA